VLQHHMGQLRAQLHHMGRLGVVGQRMVQQVVVGPHMGPHMGLLGEVVGDRLEVVEVGVGMHMVVEVEVRMSTSCLTYLK
jgi:hypothetical protein